MAVGGVLDRMSLARRIHSGSRNLSFLFPISARYARMAALARISFMASILPSLDVCIALFMTGVSSSLV